MIQEEGYEAFELGGFVEKVIGTVTVALLAEGCFAQVSQDYHEAGWQGLLDTLQQVNAGAV